MLPARHLLKNQQAKLIAGVQEVARLGIVGSSDDIAFEVPAQYLRIAPLHPPWHCRSDKWERLMTIEPTKLDNLAVEFESVFGENGLAKTNTSGISIGKRFPAEQIDLNGVQPGMLNIPQFDGAE
jgi:hypothetical protein